MQNEQMIWNWFKANSEFNDYAIAAIMGNIEAESNGLPDNVENRHTLTDEEYTVRVDNGTISRDTFAKDAYGYGLCQWTYYTRKYALYDFAKSCGVSIARMDMQLTFLIKELKSDYKTVYNSLMTAANVAAPCSRFLLCYEVPANAIDQVKKRTEMAQAIFDRNHKEETVTDSANVNDAVMNLFLDIISAQQEEIDKLNELVTQLKEAVSKL